MLVDTTTSSGHNGACGTQPKQSIVQITRPGSLHNGAITSFPSDPLDYPRSRARSPEGRTQKAPRWRPPRPGLTPLVLAADFDDARDLSEVADFLRRYMIVALDWGEVVRFYRQEAERLRGLVPPRTRGQQE